MSNITSTLSQCIHHSFPKREREIYIYICMYIKGWGVGGGEVSEDYQYTYVHCNTVQHCLFSHMHTFSLCKFTHWLSPFKCQHIPVYTHTVFTKWTSCSQSSSLCSHINTFSHSALMQHFSVNILHAAQDSPPPFPFYTNIHLCIICVY